MYSITSHENWHLVGKSYADQASGATLDRPELNRIQAAAPAGDVLGHPPTTPVGDGYPLGWNDQGRLYAHLHVLPRFDDEPLWDQGVRSAIKLPENRRPDPWAPGNGRAMAPYGRGI